MSEQRSRLIDEVPPAGIEPSQTQRQRVSPPPPSKHREAPVRSPEPVSWPVSLMTCAELVELSLSAVPVSARFSNPKGERSARRIAMRAVTGWLSTMPGRSWQERWLASGVEDDPDWADTIVAHFNSTNGVNYQRGVVPRGIAWMCAVDAIRPSYEWMHRNHEVVRGLHNIVFDVRDPSAREALEEAIDEHGKLSSRIAAQKVSALSQLARVLVRTGKRRAADISVDDLLEVRETARGIRNNLPSGAAYDAMSWAGLLPDGAPENFAKTRRTRQRSVEELVDRTGIANRRMRNLFIDYLRARSAALDYTSLTGLASTLVQNFWVELEILRPGIDSLDLDAELLDEWKAGLWVVRHGTGKGKRRTTIGPILLAVRAFYYDLADWALAEPDRYAAFAAPNPVTQADVEAFRKSIKHQKARSHARTRVRLPLLPKLLDTVESTKRWHLEALTKARNCAVGEQFVVSGIQCEVVGAEAREFGGRLLNGYKRAGGIPVRRLDNGDIFDAVHAEANHFWRWAAINVMAETGVRIEELEELTHTALVQYKLPTTGELLPLLQIAPSKTDEERVIPVSPELASVLAEMISRVRREAGTERLPLVTRWDYQEKKESAPMPFLFQREINGERRTINRAWIGRHLANAASDAGFVGDDGEPIKFANHDLRRIFTTDAIKNGLPIHIAAALLGHRDLNTTQRYNAIYEEDVYRHFRSFIDARRALRPAEEYRTPTPEEWEEFLGHYERRQTEMGICGRAFGSSCAHDGACLRCQLLRPDPAQEGRLLERIDNLKARIAEANEQRWLGEVELLEQTLAGAYQKLESMRRQVADGPTFLGLPTVRADE
ncbi:site-specific integrase [Leifsonia soli]|uniref:Integrase n=1 Tax=Leifsonia soli TaxID=582665 RepID=A0A852SZ85_9MICO|nr:site-specific integrase [Leifsonia soli]NYD74197.1 integrase [Leifsonia soli]